MKWRLCLLVLVLIGSPAMTQEPAAASLDAKALLLTPGEMAGPSQAMSTVDGPPASEGGMLAGNHNFANFIGFMSNPLQSIDPRSLTAIYPLFLGTWVSNDPPVPNADGQVYGPAVTVALSERLAVGLNQGGFAVLNLTRNQRERLIQLDPLGRFRDVEIGGTRSGFLNLGGFFQYTLIENVPDQFLITGGMRWAAPCGSHDVFQGQGPLLLAPYLTAGKELGEFHVLATAGYQFPAGPGSTTTQLWYANLHLDRCFCGWLYPLVEFNCTSHTTSASFGLQTREGFIDFGNFESSGNVVSLAVGANAVLVKEKLEVGAVYSTVIASQHNLDVNGLLVKMMWRY
jgi:hypothetical protein